MLLPKEIQNTSRLGLCLRFQLQNAERQRVKPGKGILHPCSACPRQKLGGVAGPLAWTCPLGIHRLNRHLMLILNTPTEKRTRETLGSFPCVKVDSRKLQAEPQQKPGLLPGLVSVQRSQNQSPTHGPSPNHPQPAWKAVFQVTSAPAAATNPSTEQGL